MTAGSYTLRVAEFQDVPAIEALIGASVRGLSAGVYSAQQIEAALDEVFGVDMQLIDDGTYFVIERSEVLAAAGGWSGRQRLFGKSESVHPGAEPLQHSAEVTARIRAFFVHPSFARQGLARRLYERCAREAREKGFQQFELMATLPGKPLYEALGFSELEQVALPLRDGNVLPLLRMGRAVR